MDTPPTNQPTRAPDRYDAARSRVDQLLWFAAHGFAYIAVNFGLALTVGFFPAAGYVWGWGIGLAVHTVYVLADGQDLRQGLIQWQLQRRP